MSMLYGSRTAISVIWKYSRHYRSNVISNYFKFVMYLFANTLPLIKYDNISVKV